MYFRESNVFPHFDTHRYQILNALQAFCSSLAGLIASRAVLEGMCFDQRILYSYQPSYY